MYYSRFRIKNFKGIKDTTVKLSDQTKMGVFCFVGLVRRQSILDTEHKNIRCAFGSLV